MTIQTPLFTTDQSYPFWVLRKDLDAQSGVGILNPGDFAVSAGSGFQVQVAAGQANIRQTVNTEGSSFYNGLYQVHNDGTSNPTNTVAAPVSNPRLDSVILRVYDVAEQSLGGSSKAQIEWLPGAETAGTNQTTRAGAGTLPANSILLADVLQTVGEAGTGTIYDRRPIAVPIQANAFNNAYGAVCFQPGPGMYIDNSGTWVVGFNNTQIAASVFLPRRVTSATKVRYAYLGSATLSGNYNIGIYDASGRLIVSTGSIALVTTGSSLRADAITATTFEAGMYYVCVGFASLSGSGTVNFTRITSGNVSGVWSPITNLGGTLASGGIGLPTTLAGFTDPAGNSTIAYVPLMALSAT